MVSDEVEKASRKKLAATLLAILEQNKTKVKRSLVSVLNEILKSKQLQNTDKDPGDVIEEIPKAPPQRIQQIKRGSRIWVIINDSVLLTLLNGNKLKMTFLKDKSTAPLPIQNSPTIGRTVRNRKNKRRVNISFLHKSAKTFSF